ncbi:hypothetical protein RRG08_042589 [Elysia crispata]|uniref:Uncharacterized protein n=1 Tax=Elysia crispata TaxID=231223 RepID=A0AAE0XPW6_9GAST|nr:hypothetical protein RRG08_042589 [Elysia crispata]
MEINGSSRRNRDQLVYLIRALSLREIQSNEGVEHPNNHRHHGTTSGSSSSHKVLIIIIISIIPGDNCIFIFLYTSSSFPLQPLRHRHHHLPTEY